MKHTRNRDKCKQTYDRGRMKIIWNLVDSRQIAPNTQPIKNILICQTKVLQQPLVVGWCRSSVRCISSECRIGPGWNLHSHVCLKSTEHIEYKVKLYGATTRISVYFSYFRLNYLAYIQSLSFPRFIRVRSFVSLITSWRIHKTHEYMCRSMLYAQCCLDPINCCLQLFTLWFL